MHQLTRAYRKCKEKFNNIHLIENEKNLGYCEGNNVGIRKAKGEYVAILNPDTKVEPSWLKELVTACKKQGDALYQPKILAFENNIFESAGNMLNVFGFGYPKGRGEIDKDNTTSQKILVMHQEHACLHQ